MERPRTTPPSVPHLPSASTDGTPWAQDASFPARSFNRPLLRPDSDTVVEASPAATRMVIERLAVIAAKLACGDIVVPPSVITHSILALANEGRKEGGVRVAKNSADEFIVKSRTTREGAAAHFAVLSPDHLALIAGALTNPPTQENWPVAWRDYEDCRNKRVLTCGRGDVSLVRALREQGVDAHGVDLCHWGPGTPDFLHYGTAGRLPFVDSAFDRVESRMGIFLGGQETKQAFRAALDEMVRVTVDGGTLRFASVREDLLRALVSERSDLLFVERQMPDYGTCEAVVRRTPE